MKVLGLNGREYNLDLKKYKPNLNAKKSFYHLLAREVLSEKFGGLNILEEVKLPGSSQKKSVLYLDFLIPNVKIGVEVHGAQHFKFIPYFHKTKAGFLRAKKRDLDKEEWCRINDVELIVLRWDDSEKRWREQIDNRYGTADGH